MDFVIFILYIGFITLLFWLRVPVSSFKDDSEDKSFDEEEMDILDLDEWQKDLVKDERFSPTSFGSKESGDLDDNSYYKDDN